jgi:hypothetical protein
MALRLYLGEMRRYGDVIRQDGSVINQRGEIPSLSSIDNEKLPIHTCK